MRKRALSLLLALTLICALLPTVGLPALAAPSDLGRTAFYTLAEGNIARAGTAEAQYTNTYVSPASSMWPRVNDGGRGTGSVHSNSWNAHNNMGSATTVWVEIKWDSVYTIDSTRVMWASDGGGVPMPSGAVIQYWNGTAFVQATNMKSATGTNVGQDVTSIGILRNGTAAATDPNTTWNGVTFDPVTTNRLRLLISRTTTGANCPGLFEWEIFGVADPMEAALAWAKSQLSLTNLVSNVTLPPAYPTDTAITFAYVSSNTAVLGNDGTVTRPAVGQPNASGTLTVTATKGAESKSETLAWSVKALLADADIVSRDLAWLNIGDTVNRTTNFTLPTSGPEGANITWASDSTYLWSNGTVIRPPQGSPDATAILTATVSYGTETAPKTWTVTIPAWPTGGKSIESYDPVTVNQPVGTAPRLPDYVKVYYNDGTSERRHIYWSGNSVANQTTQAGYAVGHQYALTGNVMGDPSNNNAGFVVTANITVVAEPNPVPSNVPAALPLPRRNVTIDNDPNGDQNRLTQNRALEMEWLLNVNVTSHIYNFRATAGLSTSGYSAPGGWDSATTKLKGHGHGHYMSGLALAYSSGATATQKEQLFQRMERMVRELRICQETTYVTGPEWAGNESGYREAKDRYSTNAEVVALRNVATSISGAAIDPTIYGAGYCHAIVPESLILNEIYAGYNGTWTQYGVWAPYYAVHKILQGLLDIYYELDGGTASYTLPASWGPEASAGTVTEQEVADKALTVATEMGLWIYNRLHYMTRPGTSPNTATQAGYRNNMWGPYIAGENGGTNETLARMSVIMKEKGNLDAAAKLAAAGTYFDNDYSESDSGSLPFMSSLAANRDSIRTLHSNSHIPPILGALWNFRTTGEAKYYNIAENFWDYNIGRYSYAPGGVSGNTSNGEKWVGAYNQTVGVVGGDGKIMETCATHNLIKMARDLYAHNPDDAKYMDYVERALSNQIVGSIATSTTASSLQITYGYNLGLDQSRGRGGAGTIGATCCSGTGSENHVRYQECAYYTSPDNKTFYVNLYMPTTAQWDEQYITIKQACVWPSESSTFTFTPGAGTGQFAIKFRVPWWANKNFSIKLNGQEIATSYEPSTYVSTAVRTWTASDRIVVTMPYSFNIDYAPQKRSGSSNWFGAVMYGPLVMAGTNISALTTPLTVDTRLSTGSGTNVVVNARSTQGTGVNLTRNVPTITANIGGNKTFYPTFWFPNGTAHTHYVDVVFNDTSVVDRNALYAKMTEGQSLLESGQFTAESCVALSTALTNAATVYQNSASTQVQITAAISAIAAAIANLEDIGVVDITTLQALIVTAETKLAADYTWDSFAALTTAITNARAYLVAGTYTFVGVYTQTGALNSALSGLVAISSLNKTALQEVLTQAAGLTNPPNTGEKEWAEHEFTIYTRKSWNAFLPVLAASLIVFNNDPKNFNQAEIDAAAANLNTAILALLTYELCDERGPLEDILSEAKALLARTEVFTAASLADLQEVIEFGEDRLDYASLTFPERDGTVSDIREVIDALEINVTAVNIDVAFEKTTSLGLPVIAGVTNEVTVEDTNVAGLTDGVVSGLAVGNTTYTVVSTFGEVTKTTTANINVFSTKALYDAIAAAELLDPTAYTNFGVLAAPLAAANTIKNSAASPTLAAYTTALANLINAMGALSYATVEEVVLKAPSSVKVARNKTVNLAINWKPANIELALSLTMSNPAIATAQVEEAGFGSATIAVKGVKAGSAILTIKVEADGTMVSVIVQVS